jgi:hypothetical protein
MERAASTANRRRSRSITARSSHRVRSMSGPIDVGLHWTSSDPGKPVENGHIESFNGKLRDECLNAHQFLSIDDASCKIEAWRMDYNLHRPHSALRQLSPAEFLKRRSNEDEEAALVLI